MLLTHLHADHVGSLGTLISYYYCLHGIQVTVIHPEPTIIQLLTLEGITPKGYHYLQTLPENKAGITAVPIPVKHAEDMKCYGYILSDGRECIYYSGDAAEVPESVRADFLGGMISRLYQDTSTHPSDSCLLYTSPSLFPDLSKLTNCEIIQYLGEDVDSIYNDLWKEIKAE